MFSTTIAEDQARPEAGRQAEGGRQATRLPGHLESLDSGQAGSHYEVVDVIVNLDILVIPLGYQIHQAKVHLSICIRCTCSSRKGI
jgi:hypothetical protein